MELTQSVLTIILSSTVIAALISALVSKLNHDKANKLKYITEERQRWRKELREAAVELRRIGKNDNWNGFKTVAEAKTFFQARLNPDDNEDIKLISLFKEQDGEIPAENLNELSEAISSLLKHDWERVKQETSSTGLKRAHIIILVLVLSLLVLCYTKLLDPLIGAIVGDSEINATLIKSVSVSCLYALLIVLLIVLLLLTLLDWKWRHCSKMVSTSDKGLRKLIRKALNIPYRKSIVNKAKTIKLYLIVDRKQVPIIDGLQDNSCVEGVICLCQDGFWQKWLKFIGYNKKLWQFKAIKSKDSVIVELIKIFKRKRSRRACIHWNTRKKEKPNWKKGRKIEKAIVDYHEGYETLKSKVVENKYDMAFMKATAKEISKYYYRLFKLDYTKFYYEFMTDAPLMIYAILMIPTLRDLFLQNEVVYKNLIKTFKIKSKDEANKLICPDSDQNVDFDNIMQSIGLHFFTGETQSYWKDLQTENTKVMIISVPDSCHIRGAKDMLEDIPSKDTDGKFLILDGLAYKSSDTYNPLVYLEI